MPLAMFDSPAGLGLIRPGGLGQASPFYTPTLGMSKIGVSPFQMVNEAEETGIVSFDAQNIPKKNKQFHSDLLLLSGPRGNGKSATQTILLELQLRRMLADRFQWGVWTNYQCSFAELQHPYLLEILQQYPKTARNKSVGVDEIQNATPSRRSLARINLDLTAFLTQIRKRAIDGVFTTQFPSVLDQWIIMQFSLFIRCKAHFDGRVIECFVFDYWGQYTGRDYRKTFPPRIGEHDWSFFISGVENVWGKYKTNELQPPIWADRRKEILEETGWKFGEDAWDATEEDKKALGELRETPAPEGEVMQGRAEIVLKDLVHAEGDQPFPVARYINTARRLVQSIKSVEDFAEWLKGQGYKIFLSGKQVMAARSGDYQDIHGKPPAPVAPHLRKELVKA